jgi:hypothetical protein
MRSDTSTHTRNVSKKYILQIKLRSTGTVTRVPGRHCFYQDDPAFLVRNRVVHHAFRHDAEAAHRRHLVTAFELDRNAMRARRGTAAAALPC